MSRRLRHRQIDISKDMIFRLVERLEKEEICVQDFENGISFLENISKIISELGMSLTLLCREPGDLLRNSVDIDVENTEGTGNKSESGESDNIKEQSYITHLRRLWKISISLLSGKPIETITSKLRDGKIRKRKCEMERSGDGRESKIPRTRHGNLNISEDQDGVRDSKLSLLDFCYICKTLTDARLKARHPCYPWMCHRCGDFNYRKRSQSANLDGKVALVTGGRIKIGYEIVLKLLRARAKAVVVTTRFPNDALRRFQKESDFSSFENRLHLYSLDLRFLPKVEKFCELFIKKFGQLDILVQNAAQTIRKPTIYYQNLILGENQNSSLKFDINDPEIRNQDENECQRKICACKEEFSPNCVEITSSSSRVLQFDERNGGAVHSSQMLIHPEDFKYKNDLLLQQRDFPPDRVDKDGNQLDLRTSNSWIMNLDEVETPEMVEVSLINYMSPYVILQKLIPLMKRENTRYLFPL